MKITHVISDTNIGGAGVLLSNLIESIGSPFESNVLLPLGSHLAESLKERGIAVKELPISRDKSFCPTDIPKLYSYFKANPTDILHSHASLSSRIGASLAGTKICISTRHCAHPEGQVKKKSKMQINVYNYCTRLTVSTADSATQNLIAEGISESRIVTIKNGVPERKKLDTGMGIALKRRLGIPDEARIVGSCARLEAVKGQDLILRAAPRILKLIPRVHFLFVGDGSARGSLERLAARLGISNKVTFVGFVKDPEPYENIFYINVNSSRGTETSCLATSECMSLGIPTVASDFGGNKEMIFDGTNGSIFKTDNHFSLEDKLITLLSDPCLYKILSEGALRVYKERFSVERMAEEYRSLYERLHASSYSAR